MEYDLGYKKEVLDNGISLCYRIVDVPDIALSVRINQGRLYEDERKAGISHFLEHMFFKSTKYHSGEEIKEMSESITGRRIGIDIKAETTQEQVVLEFRFPKEELNNLLNLLCEILSNDSFKEEDVEKEREIITKEIGQYEGNPIADFSTKQVQKSFPGHPYGRPVPGTLSTVKEITVDDLAEAKRRGFVGSNIYVSAVGGIDPKSLVKIFNPTLGKIERGSPSVVYHGETSPIDPEEVIGEFENYPFNNLIFWLQVPGFREKDYLSMKLIHEYLAKGMTSRLFRILREENQLCYHFEGILAGNNEKSAYMVNIQNYDTDNHRKIIDIVKDELHAMAIGKIDHKSLERIRNNFQKTFSEEYVEDIHKQATEINKVESRRTHYTLGDKYSFFSHFSVDEITRMAKQYFNDRYLIITLKPKRSI